MLKSLAVVIPCYNESATLDELVHRVLQAYTCGLELEVIIVDDDSVDTSYEIANKLAASDSRIRILKHAVNKGKGAAVRTAFEDTDADVVLIQDADLEYDPNEYNLLLKPIIDGYADVVYGSRFMGGKPHRILFFWHTIGNKLLTFLSNMFTNLNLTDMETCYKMFRTEIIQSITLKENRFGFEPEVTAKIAKLKDIRIYEIGISYYGRTYQEGKKINWKDGFWAIYCIIKYGLFAKGKSAKILI